MEIAFPMTPQKFIHDPGIFHALLGKSCLSLVNSTTLYVKQITASVGAICRTYYLRFQIKSTNKTGNSLIATDESSPLVARDNLGATSFIYPLASCMNFIVFLESLNPSLG
jgi:hypothetical protein